MAAVSSGDGPWGGGGWVEAQPKNDPRETTANKNMIDFMVEASLAGCQLARLATVYIKPRPQAALAIAGDC
jgi:hypothetical protein